VTLRRIDDAASSWLVSGPLWAGGAVDTACPSREAREEDLGPGEPGIADATAWSRGTCPLFQSTPCSGKALRGTKFAVARRREVGSMGRAFILWLLGVPASVLVLLWLFGVFH
jgi:hypothetical protein